MKVTVEPGKSTLDAIVATVEHALSTKSPVAKLVDRVSAIFVPSVIGAAILTLIASLAMAMSSVSVLTNSLRISRRAGK